MKTAITAVASSGAELPAAINVAPATSDWICSTVMKRKHGSQQIKISGMDEKLVCSLNNLPPLIKI